MKNWAGNLHYSAAATAHPSSAAELADIVAKATRVKALGSRHCFNDIADTTGTQIVLDGFGAAPEIDSERSVVRVSGSMNYGELARYVQAHGYALHNMASLPHISVAGALQTGTHGSGVGNGGLASAVKAIEVVRASGRLDRLEESDGGEFFGTVVGLGALGIVTDVELAIQPSFDVRQRVFERLPWDAALEGFEQIASSAYSVSLFTDYYEDSISQIWQKVRIDDEGGSGPGPSTFFGATAATTPRHPLPEMSGENCTEQLDVPGPWLERLPHFRHEFTPSNGDELQSEYILPREHAAEALARMRALGGRVAPLLYVSEIRTIASDGFWLSPSYGQDSVAFHLTWKPRQPEVEALLPDIENALRPLGTRPHWGKLFSAGAADLRPLYPRFDDFRALAARHDPTGKFRNTYLDRVLG